MVKVDRFAGASIALLILSVSPAAHAYIDPGVGSILIQGLIAGLAAGAALLRYYWDQVKEFFGSRGRQRESDQPSDGDT